MCPQFQPPFFRRKYIPGETEKINCCRYKRSVTANRGANPGGWGDLSPLNDFGLSPNKYMLPSPNKNMLPFPKN